MVVRAVCLTSPERNRYNRIASAMAAGIGECGDVPYIMPLRSPKMNAPTVAVCYGWKHRQWYQSYNHYVYADLGYWLRDTHYRIVVDGWSPERYVRANLPHDRLKSFGVEVQPVQCGGDTIVVAGSSAKAAAEHGLGYQQWEKDVIRHLQGFGKRIVYRPKPKDRFASPINGAMLDTQPLEESLSRACFVVTHHSNVAIDALVNGIPVHCVTGAGTAFSIPLEECANPTMPEGREQFLADVAWLNWSLDEMRSGACWRHLKERGLIC